MERESEHLSKEELERRRQNLSHNLDQFFKWMQRPDVRESRSRSNREQLREYLGDLQFMHEVVAEAEQIVEKGE